MNRHGNLFACAILVALPALLFRASYMGTGIWIGNPDRLNSGLKMALYYTRGIWGGGLTVWNEHEMLGFDSFTLPYTFPSPLIWLTSLFNAEHFLAVESWIGIGMLILAGLSALMFLRALRLGWFEATVGAACYQLSALTILKVSQNDLSFAVFIAIPATMLMIHLAKARNALVAFIALTVMLTIMLQFMFLQKVTYALMLFASYAVWRSITRRHWAPVLITAGATFVAMVIASPRIIGIALAMKQYTRATSGFDISNFNILYEFQNIRPYEVLRWFDDTIFGMSPADAAHLGNNINLSEGFLLATSPVVPMLLVGGLVAIYVRSDGREVARRFDVAFWFSVLLFTVLVVMSKPLLHLVYILFLRKDFTHARILIAGLLPMCVLVAVVLSQMKPAMTTATATVGFVAGLAIAGAIHQAAHMWSGTVSVPTSLHLLGPPAYFRLLRADAAARITLTAMATLALVLLIYWSIERRSTLGAVAYFAFGTLIVAQAFLAADFQINGPHTRNRERPFHGGAMYMAQPGEFRLPTQQQLDTLHARVGDKRVVLICPADVADGFCAGHIPETWQLRSVDGYYGLGVPTRLRALPWGHQVSLRTIAFTGTDLPWSLLGFLNVGWAVEVSMDLFKNRTADNCIADVTQVRLLPNPRPVIPRAFLARMAEPVANANEATAKIFSRAAPQDVRARTFVEGLRKTTTYDADGPVPVTGTGDRLKFDVSATSGNRLLVVNELFFPRWRAFVDGVEMPVLAANAVMRAVPLPPSARQVEMVYQPFVRSELGGILRGLGLVLSLIFAIPAAWTQRAARERYLASQIVA